MVHAVHAARNVELAVKAPAVSADLHISSVRRGGERPAAAAHAGQHREALRGAQQPSSAHVFRQSSFRAPCRLRAALQCAATADSPPAATGGTPDKLQRRESLCSSMGPSPRKEFARLTELLSLIDEAKDRLSRLLQPAFVEQAANKPPTPDSSQAAYHAANQRYVLATDELFAIYRRLSG